MGEKHPQRLPRARQRPREIRGTHPTRRHRQKRSHHPRSPPPNRKTPQPRPMNSTNPPAQVERGSLPSLPRAGAAVPAEPSASDPQNSSSPLCALSASVVNPNVSVDPPSPAHFLPYQIAWIND